MEKLTEQNSKNSPAEFDKVYFARKKDGPDESDVKRWKRLLKHFKGARLIDLGCLDSMIIPLAHKRVPTAELWGIDLAKEAITDMRRTYPYAQFEVMDAYKTKYPAEYFSYVVAGEVIEHLERPREFLTEAMRILKPGGILALSTPKEEIIDSGAVDKERHLWSFSEEDLRSMLSPFGEVSTEIIRSQYFPIYKYKFPTIICWCKKNGKQ